jgi:hypothetical protein
MLLGSDPSCRPLTFSHLEALLSGEPCWLSLMGKAFSVRSSGKPNCGSERSASESRANQGDKKIPFVAITICPLSQHHHPAYIRIRAIFSWSSLLSTLPFRKPLNTAKKKLKIQKKQLTSISKTLANLNTVACYDTSIAL